MSVEMKTRLAFGSCLAAPFIYSLIPSGLRDYSDVLASVIFGGAVSLAALYALVRCPAFDIPAAQDEWEETNWETATQLSAKRWYIYYPFMILMFLSGTITIWSGIRSLALMTV